MPSNRSPLEPPMRTWVRMVSMLMSKGIRFKVVPSIWLESPKMPQHELLPAIS
jgi:hypothetical protein